MLFWDGSWMIKLPNAPTHNIPYFTFKEAANSDCMHSQLCDCARIDECLHWITCRWPMHHIERCGHSTHLLFPFNACAHCASCAGIFLYNWTLTKWKPLESVERPHSRCGYRILWLQRAPLTNSEHLHATSGRCRYLLLEKALAIDALRARYTPLMGAPERAIIFPLTKVKTSAQYLLRHIYPILRVCRGRHSNFQQQKTPCTQNIVLILCIFSSINIPTKLSGRFKESPMEHKMGNSPANWKEKRKNKFISCAPKCGTNNISSETWEHTLLQWWGNWDIPTQICLNI